MIKSGKSTSLPFLIVVILALLVRLYNLDQMGYRFCDEGYHLLHPIILAENPAYPSLYFKHGLMVWIYSGLHLFGFSINGTLYYSVFCGMASIVLFYLLCRRLMPARHALLGGAAFAFNYYVLYYQRSNMSDGYALMFFCAALYAFVLALQGSGLLPRRGRGGFERTSPLLLLVLGGLLLGFSFTVRIQTCLTLLGVGGALAVALLFERPPKKNVFWRYVVFYAAWCLIGVVGYAVFMIAIRRHVIWDATLTWYGKNGHIAEHPSLRAWRPYLAIFLWRLCGVPFLLLALVGFLRDAWRIRRLDVVRRWLFICVVGLAAALLKVSMPWPRGYLYMVLLLVFYWVMGVEFCARLLSKGKTRRVAVYALLALTVAGELHLVIPFIEKKSGYNQVVAYMAKEGRGNLIGTHSWTVFEALPFRHGNTMVYDVCRKSGGDIGKLHALFDRSRRDNQVRYVVLDDNIVFFSPENAGLLEKYCVKYPPSAVFHNDFGDDYHTCMDAFGRPPEHGFFSEKIVVYKLEE